MSRRSRRHRRAVRRRIGTLGTLALLTVGALCVSLVGPGSARAERVAEAGSGRYSAGVAASIADIQQFWTDELPTTYGVPYRSIPTDRLFAFSEADPPPSCDDGGRGTIPYEDVKGNAFYCSSGDFVAWDEPVLFSKLRREFGDFAVALVLAHEWGHAIQARTDTQLDASVYVEMQADCFAGAWTRHVARGDRTSLRLGTGDLDTALGGYLVFRDPVGTDGARFGAHGNAFDRVSAFQDGYHDGVSACRSYESSPPDVTETGFTSREDAATGGNVSADEVPQLVTDDVSDYWNQELGKRAPAPKVVAYRGAAPACSGGSDGGVLDDGATYCATKHDRVRARRVRPAVLRRRRLRRRDAPRRRLVVCRPTRPGSGDRHRSRPPARRLPHRGLDRQRRERRARHRREARRPLGGRPRRGDPDVHRQRFG